MTESLTIEMLWDEVGFTPNESQRQAILHMDGPLYLTAEPGSGKTRVLLWRTLNLIVFHGVSPEEIVLSTFTEKAAHQLIEGLRSLLGVVTNYTGQPYDLAAMYIGTVHSLCQRMLRDRRFRSDRRRSRPPRLLDALGQYFHVYKNSSWRMLTADLGEEPEKEINGLMVGWDSASKFRAVNACIGFFNRCSEELIDPTEALALIRSDDAALQNFADEWEVDLIGLEMMLDRYAIYRNEVLTRRRVNVTDFSLVQQEAYNLLSDSPQAGEVFKHIIVDEYQDTNTIQERIFFELAARYGNICVVGDDDQALYRFRGATVENFVQFPDRCQQYLLQGAHRISLSTNYRSRDDIVNFYTCFIEHCNWQGNGNTMYRVADKNIHAHRVDGQTAVVATTPGKPDEVYVEIADLVRELLDTGKIADPNQVAVLFPSLKSVNVGRMISALEAVGLQSYAPRAGSFLEVDESVAMFGVIAQVFGVPETDEIYGRDFEAFMAWVEEIHGVGRNLADDDPWMQAFIDDRRAELARIQSDYAKLMTVVRREGWELNDIYDIDAMRPALLVVDGLSAEGHRSLNSPYFARIVYKRIEEGNPFSLSYVINRTASLDWNVLDLFYRFCGFDHFRAMFDAAEDGTDEGPICNLGLITQYLSRFMDEYIPIITAEVLVDDLYVRLFFITYLFALFRHGESEYEDADTLFPKGRVPFLTIHQAKGLEFPVVVLPNPRRNAKKPRMTERMVRPLIEREDAEPLGRISEFDMMRMFYVALSRAENLLIIGHLQGRGQFINPPFKKMLDGDFPRIPDFDVSTVPTATLTEHNLPQTYSYTGDFLLYEKCHRQYMVFRKYGFVPSRSQTMFFGSLVHSTIEDLHHELIRRREGTA